MRKELLLVQRLKTFSNENFEMEACTQDIHLLNQAYIQDAIQAVYQGKREDLDDMLKSYRKLRKVIAVLPDLGNEVFFYECGIFNGAYKVLEELNQIYMEREKQQKFSQLLDRKHVRDIFMYLYKNPDARQGKIAKDINVSPSHLSEILNLMMKLGYVERYGKNKETRYCLTKTGRLYSRNSIVTETTGNDYIDIDYREIEDKEKFLMGRIKNYNEGRLNKEDEYAKWRQDFRGDSKTVVYGQKMGNICFE